MVQLILTEQQSQLIRNAKEAVVMCDPAGHVLGHAQPALRTVEIQQLEHD